MTVKTSEVEDCSLETFHVHFLVQSQTTRLSFPYFKDLGTRCHGRSVERMPRVADACLRSRGRILPPAIDVANCKGLQTIQKTTLLDHNMALRYVRCGYLPSEVKFLLDQHWGVSDGKQSSTIPVSVLGNVSGQLLAYCGVRVRVVYLGCIDLAVHRHLVQQCKLS